jgi:hypothetical protein
MARPGFPGGPFFVLRSTAPRAFGRENTPEGVKAGSFNLKYVFEDERNAPTQDVPDRH